MRIFFVAGFVGSLALSGVSGCINATNPFDPNTPHDGQSPGTIDGSVFAIRELIGDVRRSAGLCSDLHDVPGDHSGFTIALRPLVDDPALGVGVETQQTNASGAFQLKNVPPGKYAFDVSGAGFELPPPVEVTVGIGETLTRTLCAIDATPPQTPVLAPLASVVNSSADVVVTVLAPEPGTTVLVHAVSPDDAHAAEDAQVVVAASDALDVAIDLGRGTTARLPWLVEVRAQDALGNLSDAARVSIVRDGNRPDVPRNVRVSAARDRVFVAFDPPAVSVDVDGATSYLVSYGLSARFDDSVAGCSSSGAPDGPDGAFFAVEGPSPIATTQTQQTLSGLVPGTELFIYVAAVDAAGNASCFSSVVQARPDIVTFARQSDRGPSVAQALAVLPLPRSTAGALAAGYVVISTASSLVVDALGVSHVLDSNALGVDVQGASLVLAAGLLGVTRVTLDADGAPQSTSVDSGGDVRSVSAQPGLVLKAAGSAGLFANDNQVASGEFIFAQPLADVVVALRGTGNSTVALLDRAAGFVDIDTLLVAQPDATALVDRTLVMLQGGGVVAVNLDTCLTAPAEGCLSASPRRILPAGEVPTAIGALDGLVLVATVQGSVFVLQLPTLQAIGRIGMGAEVRALVADDLGFCAALNGVAATDTAPGHEPVIACASVATFPLQDSEVRLATQAAATRAVVVPGRALVAAGASVLDVRLATDSVTGVELQSDVADLAVFGRDAIALDVQGKVWLLRDAVAALEIGDLRALGADIGEAPYTGFIATDGDQLLVVTRAQDAVTTITRASVVVAANGNVTLSAPLATLLPDTQAVTDLLVHRGTASVATAPLGMMLVDTTTLAIAPQSIPPGEPDSAAVAAVLLNGNIAAPTHDATGAGGFVRTTDAGFVGLASQAPEGISGAVSAGRFLAVTTSSTGAYLLVGDGVTQPLTPILAFPSVASAVELAVSSRGLVVADGLAGAALLRVR